MGWFPMRTGSPHHRWWPHQAGGFLHGPHRTYANYCCWGGKRTIKSFKWWPWNYLFEPQILIHLQLSLWWDSKVSPWSKLLWSSWWCLAIVKIVPRRLASRVDPSALRLPIVDIFVRHSESPPKLIQKYNPKSWCLSALDVCFFVWSWYWVEKIANLRRQKK